MAGSTKYLYTFIPNLIPNPTYGSCCVLCTIIYIFFRKIEKRSSRVVDKSWSEKYI